MKSLSKRGSERLGPSTKKLQSVLSTLKFRLFAPSEKGWVYYYARLAYSHQSPCRVFNSLAEIAESQLESDAGPWAGPKKGHPPLRPDDSFFFPSFSKAGLRVPYSHLLTSRFLLWWLYIVLLVDATYSCFIVPIEIGFVDDRDVVWARVCDLTAGSILVLDILANFFLPAVFVSPTSRFLVVADPRLIARHYVLSFPGLLIDVLCLVPFIWAITKYIGPSIQTSPIQAIRLLRLIRFYGLFRRLFSSETDVGWSGSMFGLTPRGSYAFQITFLAFFLVNLMACGFVWVANLEKSDYNWMTDVSYNDHNPSNDPEATLEYASPINVYVASIYFTLTTFATIGYGDITPVTTVERIYVMFLEIVGVLFFGVLLGSLASLLHEQQGDEHRQRKQNLMYTCKSLGFSSQMATALLLYFDHKWTQDASLHKVVDLYEELPKHLWGLLVERELLKDSLRGLGDPQTEKLLRAKAADLQPKIFRMGEVLGEERGVLCFLQAGAVEVLPGGGSTEEGFAINGQEFENGGAQAVLDAPCLLRPLAKEGGEVRGFRAEKMCLVLTTPLEDES